MRARPLAVVPPALVSALPLGWTALPRAIAKQLIEPYAKVVLVLTQSTSSFVAVARLMVSVPSTCLEVLVGVMLMRVVQQQQQVCSPLSMRMRRVLRRPLFPTTSSTSQKAMTMRSCNGEMLSHNEQSSLHNE